MALRPIRSLFVAVSIYEYNSTSINTKMPTTKDEVKLTTLINFHILTNFNVEIKDIGLA